MCLVAAAVFKTVVDASNAPGWVRFLPSPLSLNQLNIRRIQERMVWKRARTQSRPVAAQCASLRRKTDTKQIQAQTWFFPPNPAKSRQNGRCRLKVFRFPAEAASRSRFLSPSGLIFECRPTRSNGTMANGTWIWNDPATAGF